MFVFIVSQIQFDVNVQVLNMMNIYFIFFFFVGFRIFSKFFLIGFFFIEFIDGRFDLFIFIVGVVSRGFGVIVVFFFKFFVMGSFIMVFVGSVQFLIFVKENLLMFINVEEDVVGLVNIFISKIVFEEKIQCFKFNFRVIYVNLIIICKNRVFKY